MTIRERLHSDGVQVESTTFAEVVDFADQKGIGLSKEKEEIYYTSIIDILARSEGQLALIGKDMVMSQSKKDIMILASGLKAGVENKTVQEHRALVYNGISDKIWPFTKFPKVDLDSSKNGLPVQIAMGIVDEVIFTLYDIGYDLEKGMENGEVLATIKAVLKEVMSWHFLQELGKEIGVGVMDLLTNYDNTKGDIVYRKTRQLFIALGFIGVAKKIGTAAAKKIGKTVGKVGKKVKLPII